MSARFGPGSRPFFFFCCFDDRCTKIPTSCFQGYELVLDSIASVPTVWIALGCGMAHNDAEIVWLQVGVAIQPSAAKANAVGVTG